MHYGIRTFLHKGRRGVIILIKKLMLLIPKKKNLILFNSWFGNKYTDNTKYIYEYLLNRDDLEVYWYTKNKEIYEKLKREGKPVLLSSQPKAIWKQIRARLLVATIGLDDFNQFFLSNCVYLNLWHGIPLKEIEYDIYHFNKPMQQTKADKRMIAFLDLLRCGIEEYIVATSETVKDIYIKAFRFQSNQVLDLGQPRNDVFYDESLREGINTIVKQIKGDKKAIVYMPTHRHCGRIKLPMSELLDFSKIQELCEMHGYVFLIKKHYYHRSEVEDVSEFNNIFDITNEELDPQVLLYEADALITDYSGCYYDYLLLNRPIIFYSFDIKKYLKNERDMYFSYEERIVGPQCLDKNELSIAIEGLLLNATDKFEGKRVSLRDTYYSKQNQQCVRGQIEEFINGVINSY